MITNINVGCDPARVQQNKQSFFVNYTENGKAEYQFFGSRSGAEDYKNRLTILAEKVNSLSLTKIGLKIHCTDAAGNIADFLYCLESGLQISKSYVDLYDLLKNIKSEFPNYTSDAKLSLFCYI